MSFSGLKTFVLNTWMKSDKKEQTKANIAAAFQKAVVETLLIKSTRALKQTQYKTLVIAGGVSANKQLREKFSDFAKKENILLIYPEIRFCTDNGAMIAYAGARRLLANEEDSVGFQTKARWSLESLKITP